MSENELQESHLPIESVEIERNVRHETYDGVSINATVYRPSISDDIPVPAVVNRSIYGIPEDVVARGWYLDDAFVAKALSNGYAVIYESTRGTGKSGGSFTWAEDEIEDGTRCIEWIAEQPWCDGNVGMFGGSSRGLAMMLAAGGNPEPLKAINPIASPSGGGDGSITDGALETNSFIPWTMKLATLTAGRMLANEEIDADTFDAIQAAAMEATEQTTELASFHPMLDLPDHIFDGVGLPDDIRAKDLIPFWEPWLSRDGDDPYWHDIDPMYLYEAMDVPALHVTGWFDSMQYGTIDNYRGMLETSDQDQFLIVGPYHHMNIGQSDCQGAIDFGMRSGLTGLTFSGFAELQLEFFEIYLKGKEPSSDSLFHPSVDPVQTFRMHPDGGEWTSHADWPPAAASSRRFFLRSDGAAATDHASGQLRDDPPSGSEPADSFVHDPTDPIPSRGGALSCRTTHHPPGIHDIADLQQRRDIVTYTSEVLDESLELVGDGKVTLHCATTGEATDFIARLSHVLGDGRVFNITEGITRTGWTKESVTRRNDDTLTVEITLWDTHYRIPGGDRLRLEIMSSSVPRFDPHTGHTDTWGAAEAMEVEQTILHDDGHPSSVSLWVR